MHLAIGFRQYFHTQIVNMLTPDLTEAASTTSNVAPQANEFLVNICKERKDKLAPDALGNKDGKSWKATLPGNLTAKDTALIDAGNELNVGIRKDAIVERIPLLVQASGQGAHQGRHFCKGAWARG